MCLWLPLDITRDTFGPDFVRLDSRTRHECVSGYVERKPKIAPADLKTRWHDAHKGHGSTVEPVGVAKHVGGAIEEFGPKAVTDDENGRCPRPVIVGTQATAE